MSPFTINLSIVIINFCIVFYDISMLSDTVVTNHYSHHRKLFAPCFWRILPELYIARVCSGKVESNVGYSNPTSSRGLLPPAPSSRTRFHITSVVATSTWCRGSLLDKRTDEGNINPLLSRNSERERRTVKAIRLSRARSDSG